MCECCNVGTGNIELLCCDDVDVAIGELKIAEGELGVYVGETMNGYHYLKAIVGTDKGNMAAVMLELDYCPFCGRELKHKPKKIIPGFK